MGEGTATRGDARRRGWRRAATALATVVLALAALGSGAPGWARSGPPGAEVGASAEIALAELPREAREVMRLIRQGGPFPYDKDGTVFFNRERLLPVYKRGYYREYTVPTPGVRHRGARRIVCGGWEPTVPDACYYTADHYASFRRIVP
ncbi:ribonuclease domain-containing protein [Tepidimonas sp.]|uniref:ribonuclease domain-containing protein n=1 Tax=Tepidimonas sp. TaxID=2002775 RepID=UPI002FE0CD14